MASSKKPPKPTRFYFWTRTLSLSDLNLPRRSKRMIDALRLLSLIPSIFGFFYNNQLALAVPVRDAGGALIIQSSQLDYVVASFWCFLAGWWNWILTTSMMRRWIFHYEVSSAIVRLVTFIVITWSISAYVNSQNGPDQPVRTWMINCFILLITDIIRLSIVSDPKYHGNKSFRQDPRVFLQFTVLKVLIFPMTVATCLSVFAVLLQMDTLYYTASQLMVGQPVLLNHQLELASVQGSVGILILIVSSWSKDAFDKRQMIRKTCLQFMHQHNKETTRVTYRFVIGRPPSAQVQMMTGPAIIRESNAYQDMIMVPASDLNQDKSRKVFESLVWANQYDYDYIIKSDDNVFVRWDTILNELTTTDDKRPLYYWQGLTWNHIPIQLLQPNDNLFIDYALPILPSYTHGMFYILSKSTVHLILQPSWIPRRFLQQQLDGENIALWLFGFDIKPIHDRRIQDAQDVCQSDLIAKKIHSLSDMKKMYSNVMIGKDQCEGMDGTGCAVCYPCHDKKVSWRTLNLFCDANGITVRPIAGFNQVIGRE